MMTWRDIQKDPPPEFENDESFSWDTMLLADERTGWVGEGYWSHGWWVANGHSTDAHDSSCTPTHWQPLPPPPGEG